MRLDSSEEIRRPAVVNLVAHILEFIPVVTHGADKQDFLLRMGSPFAQKPVVFN